jgi:radical SAM superfamily enzyme YgiQ (UPF0313 family)
VKVLIVATNRCRDPFPVMPYGACVVAEAAERAGHRVEVLDLMFEERPEAALDRRLRAFRPGAVGFSVRNIDNNDMRAPRSLYRELRDLVGAVRRELAVPTIIGGPAVGVMPAALLDYSFADWAALGDGERVFPAFLSALESGGSLREIPGLAWIGEHGYEARPIAHGDVQEAPLVPDYGRWLELGRYRAAMAAAPVQSKRGCPYDCVYCRYSANEGRGYRLHAPGRVAEAVERLAAGGARDIEFVDNVFNSPHDHAVAVCREIARRKVRARLHTLELNPRFTDDELLTAMEEAGFAAVGMTAESASDRALAGLGKNYRRADLERAAESIARHRIPCLWIFLVGGPGETEETLAETLDFAERRVRAADSAFFNVGIRIYPGTGLERIALEQQVIDRPATDMLDPVFYTAPGLDLVGVERLLSAAVRRNLRFMNAAALAHPMLPALTRLAVGLRLRPPIWRHTVRLRQALRFLGRDIA